MVVRFRQYIQFLLSSLIFACASASFAQQMPQTDAVPGEYIIKYRSNGLMQTVRSKLQGKANLKGVLSEGSVYHVAMKSENIESVQQDPDVEFIEPNYYLIKSASTSFSQNLAPVKVLQSWGISSAYSANNRPIVAVIDTGTDPNHRVFAQTGALWVNNGEIPNNGIDDDFNGYVDDVSGWNFINNTKTFNDDEGHGTHVSGIIVGTSLDIFASTLDPAKIRIMPLKFLDSQGSGTTANAIKAVYYAVNNGAQVINCSWGGGSYSQSLHEALAFAYNRGIVVVAAAGNNAKNNDTVAMYPANYDVPSLISVAATTDNDNLASFSNYGPQLVQVGAPGYQVYSTYLNGSYTFMSGTSMASPFVAGIAAMAIREAPALTGYQIKQLITSSVDVVNGVNGKVSTNGRVNALSLLQSAKSAAANSIQPSQPSYSPAYKADRAPSSESAAGGGGAGCGLVKALSSGGGGAGPGFLIVTLIPLLVWLVIRLRVRSPADKRKYERFKLESAITVKVGNRELVASMKTISVGGASFCTESALEKGGLVTMKIQSPDGQEQLEVQGHVVWCENNKAYGVQFSQAREGVIQSIQGWTHNLVKSR